MKKIMRKVITITRIYFAGQVIPADVNATISTMAAASRYFDYTRCSKRRFRRAYFLYHAPRSFSNKGRLSLKMISHYMRYYYQYFHAIFTPPFSARYERCFIFACRRAAGRAARIAARDMPTYFRLMRRACTIITDAARQKAYL